jgi:peptidoglycan hydrolase CwlO-like protein
MQVKMRIVKETKIEGKRARALFDTGSMPGYNGAKQVTP